MNGSSRWTIRQVAQDLSVPYPDMDQDWGISNADPTRLGEFVAYYGRHAPTFDDWAVEHDVGELLLESAREALALGVGDPQHAEAAVHLVVARRASEPTRVLLAYWTGLEIDDDFVNDPESVA